MAEPKDPWADEQLQSTPAGPPDTKPWAVTLAVIAILVFLVLGGYLLWRHHDTAPQTAAPASPR